MSNQSFSFNTMTVTRIGGYASCMGMETVPNVSVKLDIWVPVRFVREDCRPEDRAAMYASMFGA